VWKNNVTYQDVHHGWIWDDSANSNGYRLNWDAATGFANSYKCKHMDGGYIDVWDVTVK